MQKKFSQSSWLAILAFSLLSSIAQADPAKDTALGEAAFKNEDVIGAMSYFTKAAKENYAPAQVRLGDILDGAGSDKEAVNWYRKAANQGNAAGEFNLGRMYISGEGIERNTEKALYWVRLAAEKDNIHALKLLAEAYQKGELGLTIDLDQAKSISDRLNILEAIARKEAERKAAEKAAEKKAAIEAAEKTDKEQKNDSTN